MKFSEGKDFEENSGRAGRERRQSMGVVRSAPDIKPAGVLRTSSGRPKHESRFVALPSSSGNAHKS